MQKSKTNKEELVKKISELNKCTIKEAAHIIRIFVKSISYLLENNKTIILKNFATFKCEKFKERNFFWARKLGNKIIEPVVDPAYLVPKVKFAKSIKKAIKDKSLV